MNRILFNLVLITLLALGVVVTFLLLARFAPVNSRTCFGTASDNHLRWHSMSECAH